MNTVTKHPSPANRFAPTFYSVQSVTDEGAPYTFACIYHNKHGRTNLTGVGMSGRFYAGSSNRSSVVKYARTVRPDTTERVFIDRGIPRVVANR
jgi:hypothetical protein